MSLRLCELQQGAAHHGDCCSSPAQPPEWLDKEKFNRGRKFFMDHFLSILLAMYVSLASGLGVTNLLVPLVYTGKSDTPKKSFRRYFSTFRQVVLWHLGNVWDSPHGVAHESILNVRHMHKQVAASMDQNEPGKFHMSQYDMVLVQCGFMGAVVMYPRQLGIRCSQTDLEDYIHFWRGIGYLLGIDDRFNLCQGNFQQTYKICKEIETEILAPALRSPPPEFKKMATAFIEGSNTPVKFKLFSFEAIFAWIFENMSLPVTAPKMGIFDRIRLWLYKTTVYALANYPSLERVVNGWFIKQWYKFLKLDQNEELIA